MLEMGPTQFSPQCGDNLFAIGRPLFLENILPDTPANMPIQQDQFGIDRLGDLLSGVNDQGA